MISWSSSRSSANWARLNACAFSKHYPPENYVIGHCRKPRAMTGWVLRWLSAVRTRLSHRLDLLLEFIVLRHQLAVLQRTGTRRPCFRPSERLFWVFLSRWWANWQRGLIIVQPATVLRWRRRGFWAIWGSCSCRSWRRAYSPNEPREFLMGRATDPCRAAETWIRCFASHSVPLHAATGLSAHPEVAHLPAASRVVAWAAWSRSWLPRSRKRSRMKRQGMIELPPHYLLGISYSIV
jgi:hypothetical protein